MEGDIGELIVDEEEDDRDELEECEDKEQLDEFGDILTTEEHKKLGADAT